MTHEYVYFRVEGGSGILNDLMKQREMRGGGAMLNKGESFIKTRGRALETKVSRRGASIS